MGDYYRSRGIDLPVDRLIDRALAEGRALVMLDGLDEVQQLAQRTLGGAAGGGVLRLPASSAATSSSSPAASSAIAACAQRRTDLKECTLVDFDNDDILLFLEKWTQALEQAAKGASTVTQLAAAEEKAELLFALERNPGVRQLAANPAAAHDPGADEAAGGAAAGAPGAVV
jgi:hypothetical protein